MDNVRWPPSTVIIRFCFWTVSKNGLIDYIQIWPADATDPQGVPYVKVTLNSLL